MSGVLVAGCGGGAGSEQSDSSGSRAAPNGPGRADAANDQNGGGTPGGDANGRIQDGGSPPTAGPGTAGELVGPGGGNAEGCGDVDLDVEERLANGESDLLRDELACIFDNADQLPEHVVDAAREAEATLQAIEGQEHSTGTDPGSNPEPEPEPDDGEAETDREPAPETEPEPGPEPGG